MSTSDQPPDAAPRQPRRIVFLVDVDNTLLDNDAAKAELDRRLAALLGQAEAARFWLLYEEVRAELSAVDIPVTLTRFSAGATGEAARARRFALADLFMTFPFDEYLYPATRGVLAHLGSIGQVVILSDGDPIFQMAKISRGGLADLVDGYALVFTHKDEHLIEIEGAFPADHYVAIDDKPTILQRLAARMTSPFSSVFVRQGHYAANVPPGSVAAAGLTIDQIGDLLSIDAAQLIAAGTGVAPSQSTDVP